MDSTVVQESLDACAEGRQKLPLGPWTDEPDRLEFTSFGLPCLIVRNPNMLHLCGYVAVPPGHPLHGRQMMDPLISRLDVHGGITYANVCSHSICHVPKPGEPDDVWWFGFDFWHGGDLIPSTLQLRSFTRRTNSWGPERYWTIPDVVAEIQDLAEQISAVKALKVKA